MSTWLVRMPGQNAVTITDELTIGRDPRCDLLVSHASVSRIHCRLRVTDGRLVLHDESRHGTSVNGIRVQESTVLTYGDVIEIANAEFTVDEGTDVLAKTAEVATVGSSYPPPPTVAPTAASAAAGRSFRLEVVETEPESRYRDAVRLADGSVLLVMTDILATRSEPPMPPPRRLLPEWITRWKAAMRDGATRRESPDAVLQTLNQELFATSLTASATCARLDPNELLLTVACAGAPPPWVVRRESRPVRVQSPPSIELGRVRGAQFATRSLHFGVGDTLLLASVAYNGPFARVLGGGAIVTGAVADWVRSQMPSTGASVLCLTLDA